MDESTGSEPSVVSVLETIELIESMKAKANEHKIITYLIKNNKLKTSSAKNLINQALTQGYIDRLNSGSYIVSDEYKPFEGIDESNTKTKNKFESEMETKCNSKEENTIPDGTSLLANQSITGAQKRQKRSTAPVLQRIRPISKRKKFKKSLGPDFLEPAELGMQYLRDTYEPKCDICSLTMFSSSTSLNVFEELLHCNNCDAKAHPSCVNLNDEVGFKTQWQCHSCKSCHVCTGSQQNDSKEFVIICMTCSKGFHPRCHTTPIVDRPKGNWYCNNCCSKGSSNTSQLINGMSNKKFLYESDDSLQSEDETLVTHKEEKTFKLVLENDNNLQMLDKQRDNSDESFDEQKVTQIKNENIDDNREGSENMDVINGNDSIKDDNNEEEGNQVDNDLNANPESGEVNQTLIPTITPQKWSVEEVETFIRDSGFPSESLIFKEQEIDGRSLLLLRRMDVLTGLSLKLGPALKIYNHISRLQGRHSSSNSS